MTCDGIPPISRTLADAQVAWMRRLGPAGRLRVALDLSDEHIHDVKTMLRALHPGASRTEIGVKWVEYAYGVELADAYGKRLVKTGRLVPRV